MYIAVEQWQFGCIGGSLTPGMIFFTLIMVNSDRGVQYTSEEYRKATEGMDRSYSKKGTTWNNACIESWHSLLKRECIRFHKIMNYHEAKSIIFSYIEGFYNMVRIHSHCEYQSPDEYEEEYYD